MSGKKTLTALSTALVLGTLGAASVAQASDNNSGDYHGGFVVPGSSGVNPVYHPRWFGQGAKAYAFVPPAKHPATRPNIHQEDNYGPEAGKD